MAADSKDMRTVIIIKALLLKASSVDMGSIIGPAEMCIRGNGPMEFKKGKAYGLTRQVGIHMLAIGRMGRQRDKESIKRRMEKSTKDSGRMD